MQRLLMYGLRCWKWIVISINNQYIPLYSMGPVTIVVVEKDSGVLFLLD